MIYIIGGVTRSGKSVLTRQLSKKYGVSYFNLDHLMMGMLESHIDLGINGHTHDRIKSEKLWQVVKPMLKSMIEDEDDYIVDGVLIFPNQFLEMQKLYPDQLKSCWIGYADVNPKNKFDEIRNNHSLELLGDWLKDQDDEMVKEIVEYGIGLSQEVKQECLENQLPYVEVSHNFDKALGKVEKILFE